MQFMEMLWCYLSLLAQICNEMMGKSLSLYLFPRERERKKERKKERQRKRGYGVMIGSHEQERTKDFFAVSVNESRVPSTKDQTEAGQERSLLQHSLKQSNND
jgi:hypothetical protein